jgi:hypothetical protein
MEHQFTSSFLAIIGSLVTRDIHVTQQPAEDNPISCQDEAQLGFVKPEDDHS